jgi:hypothetical protein
VSLCQVGDCTRPGVRYLADGITRACWAHVKREHRGRPLYVAVKPPQGGRTPRRPRAARLAAAALRYANSDGQEDFELAWENLVDAAREFVLHKKRGARVARRALGL